MKKILAMLLVAVMVCGLFAGCGSSDNAPAATNAPAANTPAPAPAPAAPSAEGKTVINLWSFTDEIQGMMNKYLELNPALAEKFEISSTVINNDGDAYVMAIDSALMNGDVDIYGAEAAYVYKYAQGDASEYAAAYAELGIDLSQLQSAEIAQYTVDIGTRPSDNALVALGYQATGGAFIYRRSIAKAVLGSDDPAVVEAAIGAGSGNWEKFFECAEQMKAAGYKMVSGKGDVWNVIEKAAPTGWVVDNTLNIDPMREEYLDIAKKLKDNDYMNDTAAWQEGWFADMTASSPVFGFYGPAWLINYTLGPNSGEGDNSSNGDWACCSPNVGFFWGGTWLLAGKGALAAEKAEFVKGFIEWVTLDTTDTGLQYLWANGLMNENGTKDTVASSVVMAKSNGETDFLGGQNMFDTFVPATVYASGKSMTQYDSTINNAWDAAVGSYVAGEITREAALEQFKTTVCDTLGLDY